MLIVFVLVAMGVVAGVAVLLARDRHLLDDDPNPGRPLDWPATGPTADDVDRVRFGIAVRGYRMDQVDRVLDDLHQALAERDRVIEELRSAEVARDREP